MVFNLLSMCREELYLQDPIENVLSFHNDPPENKKIYILLYLSISKCQILDFPKFIKKFI